MAVSYTHLDVYKRQPKGQTDADKIYTVPELKKDAVLRHKIWAWCQESPGERHGMPNCLNAAHAGY